MFFVTSFKQLFLLVAKPTIKHKSVTIIKPFLRETVAISQGNCVWETFVLVCIQHKFYQHLCSCDLELILVPCHSKGYFWTESTTCISDLHRQGPWGSLQVPVPFQDGEQTATRMLSRASPQRGKQRARGQVPSTGYPSLNRSHSLVPPPVVKKEQRLIKCHTSSSTNFKMLATHSIF